MLNICKFYSSRLLRVSAGVVNGADLKSAGLWPQRFESSLIRYFCTFIGASILLSNNLFTLCHQFILFYTIGLF